MSHKDNIKLSELKQSMSDVYDSVEYIDEYGYVGCYELKPEQIKEKSDRIIELIKQSNLLLEEIKDSICDSFEH